MYRTILFGVQLSAVSTVQLCGGGSDAPLEAPLSASNEVIDGRWVASTSWHEATVTFTRDSANEWTAVGKLEEFVQLGEDVVEAKIEFEGRLLDRDDDMYELKIDRAETTADGAEADLLFDESFRCEMEVVEIAQLDCSGQFYRMVFEATN